MTCLADKYLLPKQLKFTTKYTERERKKVKQRYKDGYAQRAIARMIPMSRRMVSFILFPERMDKCKQQFAIRQKTGRYRYPTTIQSAMVKKVRHHKRKILNKLILKP
jgi:hypothetical protein